jgi:hypothetical protein
LNFNKEYNFENIYEFHKELFLDIIKKSKNYNLFNFYLVYDLTSVEDFNNFFKEFLNYKNNNKKFEILETNNDNDNNNNNDKDEKNKFVRKNGYYNLKAQNNSIKNFTIKDIDKILSSNEDNSNNSFNNNSILVEYNDKFFNSNENYSVNNNDENNLFQNNYTIKNKIGNGGEGIVIIIF